MRILLGWAINALCLMALPYLLPAVTMKSFTTALIVALVIGLLNTFIRPVLFVLTLPISVITLGLFTLVLNGLMFWLASRWVDGFHVASFAWSIVAALVYSLISWAISSLLLREGKRRP